MTEVGKLLHKAIANIEGIHPEVHQHERDEIRQGECAICLAHVCLVKIRRELEAEAQQAPTVTRVQVMDAIEDILACEGAHSPPLRTSIAVHVVAKLEALGVVRLKGE